MPSLFEQSELSDLVEKVEKGDRLGFEAGVRMMNSQDILTLGYMANLVRERKNGNRTYFVVKKEESQSLTLENEGHETATMFYGHMASTEERIDQLIQLRALQERTGEFLAFKPLPRYPNPKSEETMGVANTTGFEDLKMLSIARILLDNFDHIKACWGMIGPKLAQVSLAFGVDDLESNEGMSERAFILLIQKGGRDAVERDTLYRVLKTH